MIKEKKKKKKKDFFFILVRLSAHAERLVKQTVKVYSTDIVGTMMLV